MKKRTKTLILLLMIILLTMLLVAATFPDYLIRFLQQFK